MTVSGLTFKIDRTVFMGFGSIFLVYFSYAFVMRAFELYFSKRISALQEGMKELLREIREVDISSIQIGDRADLETRLKDAITDVQKMSEKMQSWVLFGLEIIPPLLLAGYTAYKVGAAGATIQFLRF
ncbi:hypothetical protein [Rhizobium anhuiense]|uniref:hypothetical protein n=1 Tax=Rhizobium anhuiense TaxID=1184720 RepID=UPI00117B5E0C|nr:hypothetical protein [Rhizobium anhuiense]